ncbi:Putative Hydroxylase [Kitasatospora sp. MMS16-BH015]|uniref:2OG-Fe(II) oxygenase n=1 Tax=Kitasatospora sp. MMS16-BH015 TaxID=2018025 RepID=UPI000CA354E9|nr:2OG-Fe(II) oxygenase [Kitasatospora sp. MMS16-BH015]AUG78261.1 Putative Hydroxylase [Kitasatospora sp. MMS16-BH015]
MTTVQTVPGTSVPATPAGVDFAALRSAALHDAPFAWGTVHGMLGPELLDRLVEEFPAEGFTRTERVSLRPGEKGYRTDNLTLVHDSRPDPEALRRLTPSWRELVESLASPEYRAAVGELTGRDVSAAALEIRAVRYPAGAWIDPHTDRLDKLVTQTWYFNAHWPEEHAGHFLVLGSADVADVRRRVLPRAGESIVMCPSEFSWHAVSPVADSVVEDRKVLLLHLTER